MSRPFRRAGATARLTSLPPLVLASTAFAIAAPIGDRNSSVDLVLAALAWFAIAAAVSLAVNRIRLLAIRIEAAHIAGLAALVAFSLAVTALTLRGDALGLARQHEPFLPVLALIVAPLVLTASVIRVLRPHNARGAAQSG